MRRRFAALAALASAAPWLVRAQPAPQPMRVVVQMSEADPARWDVALNNVRNLLEVVGAANVTVEIVAYGPGIGMLTRDAPTGTRVAEAVQAGVAVYACENTMRNRKLVRGDMHPGVGYVPAGVVEIVRRQQEGWAYLRP